MGLSTVVAIMLAAGLSGGLVNWALTSSDGSDKRPWWSHVLTGIAGAFLVPLFLHITSSDLLAKLSDGSGAGGSTSLVFAGFCLVAAISSKAFIQSLSKRVLQMAEEAKKTADEAVETAKAATAVSLAAQDQAEYLAPPAAAAAAGVVTISRGQTPDDPWKGQFGGSKESTGRILEAKFHPVPDTQGELVVVTLTVRSTDPRNKLTGDVQFYLHDTFPNPTPVVPVGPNGTATLNLTSWGAFTVGALADGGKTKLELDLADLPDAPEPFRSR